MVLQTAREGWWQIAREDIEISVLVERKGGKRLRDQAADHYRDPRTRAVVAGKAFEHDAVALRPFCNSVRPKSYEVSRLSPLVAEFLDEILAHRKGARRRHEVEEVRNRSAEPHL